MKIGRYISDFGNSITQNMIDGHYFEMPSSITEITQKEAEGLFAESVDPDNLLKNVVIAIPYNDTKMYFKVGEKATADALGNNHITRLHDKTESITVKALFLGSLAFYHAYKNPRIDREQECIVTIEYFQTMLPVWLVKKAPKFSDMLNKMSNRFLEPMEVEILTPLFERKIIVEVNDASCRIESETARFALKYDLELNKLDSASQFESTIVVINDLGGQTQDLSKLRPGLKRPESADDFKPFTDRSYLKTIEDLRISKLSDLFTDLRSLEAFIFQNIKKKFVFKDPTTQQEIDVTEVIESSIENYVKVSIEKALTAFQFTAGQKVVFVHIGGVSELLKDYMQAYLSQKIGQEIAEEYHIFPENARKLNIYGGEILAKSELKKRELESRTGE